jgi:hypothetical protein
MRNQFYAVLCFPLIASLALCQDVPPQVFPVEIPQAALHTLLREKLPASAPLPEQHFGNIRVGKLMKWDDIRITNAVATLAPDSLQVTLEAPNKVTLSIGGSIHGNLCYEYWHDKWFKRKPKTATGTIDADFTISTTFTIEPGRCDGTVSDRQLAVDITPSASRSNATIRNVRVDGVNGRLRDLVEAFGASLANHATARAIPAQLPKLTHRIDTAAEKLGATLNVTSVDIRNNVLHLVLKTK